MRIELLFTMFMLVGCQSQHLATSSVPNVPNESENIPTNFNTQVEKNTSFDRAKPVSFQQAMDYVLHHSDKLSAAQAGWKASQLQADALDLHQPVVMLGSMAGRYNVETDISTAHLRERLQGYGTALASQVGGVAQQFPQLAPLLQKGLGSIAQLPSQIPSDIHLQKRDNFSRANVTALLPLYTGGRIDAIQEFAQGRADADATKIATTEEELLKTLITRYFQVQLAERAVNVREIALRSVKGHNHLAKRMFELGVISKIQRLQATAALSDAEFQLDKAKDNLRLAQRALNSLLQTKDVKVATKLFVKNEKLLPLNAFQAKAQAYYPIFTQIKAKRKQAKAMEKLSDAAWKPNVAAFGGYQLGKDHNWVVGVNANWTLHRSVDRSKMQQAAQMTLTQIDAIERQVKQDINLLVEKNWLVVDDLRLRYQALEKEETLAQQVLKLHEAGFKEGINTVIELNDAQAKLVKVQTEQASVAYEYVMALAELLASTGNLQSFANYIPTDLMN
ncbi:TolC family protein [Phocoenobacter uteri]|nr:TolC family protein [Phocoenobacter uteri]